jgi:hypothetical protein
MVAFVHPSFCACQLVSPVARCRRVFSLYNNAGGTRPLAAVDGFWSCAAGSLVVSVLACPAVAAQGLCGLSGVGHGLLAVVAVDLLRDPGQREIHCWVLRPS